MSILDKILGSEFKIRVKEVRETLLSGHSSVSNLSSHHEPLQEGAIALQAMEIRTFRMSLFGWQDFEWRLKDTEGYYQRVSCSPPKFLKQKVLKLKSSPPATKFSLLLNSTMCLCLWFFYQNAQV